MHKLLVSVGVVLGCITAPLSAQPYPAKPIRVINPFVAGGGVDAIFRPLTQKMGESMKATFVIDNRPGANGMIAMEMTAKSPPDGYTVVTGTTGAVSMNMVVYPKLPYDSLRDFVPISNVAESAFILSVHPSVPARSVQELVTLARTRAGQLTYSSFGVASSAHFGAELFAMMTGTKLVHVPYKGSAQAVAALLGGEVMFSFDSMQSTMPHIRAHRLRPLGIAAARRSPAAPDIPTVSESGVPGFEVGSWYGLLAPAHTPHEIVARLHDEVVKALNSPDMRERLAAVGTEPVGNTPEEFAAQIRSDIVKWAKVAKAANIHPE
jgi:Uncharacterized protein conserved in bacteria